MIEKAMVWFSFGGPTSMSNATTAHTVPLDTVTTISAVHVKDGGSFCPNAPFGQDQRYHSQMPS